MRGKGGRLSLPRCIWEHRDASVLFGRIETVLFPSGSYTVYTMCTQAIMHPVQCKEVSCSFPQVNIQILILKFYSFCSWVVADPSFFPNYYLLHYIPLASKCPVLGSALCLADSKESQGLNLERRCDRYNRPLPSTCTISLSPRCWIAPWTAAS